MKIHPKANQQASTIPSTPRNRKENVYFQRLAGEVCRIPELLTMRQRKLPANKKLLIDSTVWLAAGTRQWGNWFRRLMTYAPQRNWTLLLDYTVFDELHQLLDGPHHSAAERALNLIAEFRNELQSIGQFRELPRTSGEYIIMPWDRVRHILSQEKDCVLITRSMNIPEEEFMHHDADQYIYYAENYVPLIR